MAWSKVKQQLESFLCPALVGRVEYMATSYRYAADKSGRCCILVDKKEVFRMNDISTMIKWYQTEQDIKKDIELHIYITTEEIEVLRQETLGKISEDRLYVIARNRKASDIARDILAAQGVLCKSDFYKAVGEFLTTSIEESLESKEILANILAIVDRRLGKKRLLGMRDKINEKHPIVQYFYELRCSTF